jgi:hypothetical protein
LAWRAAGKVVEQYHVWPGSEAAAGYGDLLIETDRPAYLTDSGLGQGRSGNQSKPESEHKLRQTNIEHYFPPLTSAAAAMSTRDSLRHSNIWANGHSVNDAGLSAAGNQRQRPGADEARRWPPPDRAFGAGG